MNTARICLIVLITCFTPRLLPAQWVQISNGLIDTTLHISDQVIVSLGTDCVNAHSGPSVTDSTYECIPAGTSGQIVDGPVYDRHGSSNLQFWYVVFPNINGWCAGKYLHKTNLAAPFVYSLAGSGTNLFAGTNAGIYRSTNGGADWENISPALTDYNLPTVAVNGTNIFFGTWAGVFRSTNNGSTWTDVTNGLPSSRIQALFVYGTNLFAGIYTSTGVWKTTDNGTSWTGAYSGLTGDGRRFAASGGNLFAATDVYVFVSANGGLTWTRTGAGLPPDRYGDGVMVISLAASGTNVFAGVLGNAGNSVYCSINSGTSWNETPLHSTVSALAFSEGNIFAGVGDVLLSTNNGTSWNSTGLSGMSVYSLMVSGNSLFAGTSGNGVWRLSISDVIPITLASFSVLPMSRIGYVKVEWKTTSEINNFGFVVEKDTAATQQVFTAIQGSFTPGQGTTLEPHTYTFIDSNTTPGKWAYRLKQIDLDNTVHVFEPVLVNLTITGMEDGPAVPTVITLHQNYPNPFNPSTIIRYDLPARLHVSLAVFNTLGQQVATLVQGDQEAGCHEVQFDASGLSSGVYFYRIEAGAFVATKTLLVLR